MQEQGDKSDGKVLIESVQESRRNDPNREATGQVWMFISAALFGYFGFGVGWDHTWGTFYDNRDNNDVDATQACCGCGAEPGTCRRE